MIMKVKMMDFSNSNKLHTLSVTTRCCFDHSVFINLPNSHTDQRETVIPVTSKETFIERLNNFPKTLGY